MVQGRRLGVRISVVVALVAGLLAPAVAAPARTISVPMTLARSLSSRADGLTVKPAFRPTHVAFSWKGSEEGAIEFRTIGSGGAASRWRRAPEAHDMEHDDRHYSGVIAVDRPALIAWRASNSSAVREVTVDYLNTLDGPRRTVRIPAVAEAAASTPTIVTRAQWGADESLKRTSGGCKRTFFRVQQLFVHHTAGSNFDTNPAATMRAIYWYHTARRGWCDLGYNFVIGPDGRIFEGRWARRYAPWEVHSSEDRSGRAVAGAHVSGYNSGSVGVSLMGNFMSTAPTPAARRSLAELLAWEADRHDIPPLSRHTYRNPETGTTRKLPFIAGHRDAGYTSCPGTILYRQLDQVRRDVAAVMADGKTSSSITLSASATKVDHGSTVDVSGTLTDATGRALPGRPITIYRKPAGGAWTHDAIVTTGVDGTYSYSTTAQRNFTVAAVYDGDGETWGALSPNVVVRVRPIVTLTPQGGTPTVTGGYHYPSGTTAVTLSGEITPAHAGHRVRLRIFAVDETGASEVALERTLTLDGASRYGYEYAVPGDGTYRAIVWFGGDADHAAARGGPVTFEIGPI